MCQDCSSPAFSCYTTLKISRVELSLLPDIDQVLLFERGMRGGLTTLVNCYAETNNANMGALYQRENENKFLLYLDVNSLYSLIFTSLFCISVLCNAMERMIEFYFCSLFCITLSR